MTLPKLQKSLLSLKSWLFTPATKFDSFARAGDAHADVLIIDLEDSVAPSAKKAARETALLTRSPLDPVDQKCLGRDRDNHG